MGAKTKPQKPRLLARIYTLDLLTRALGKLAIGQALSLACRIARTRLSGQRHVVYSMATDAIAGSLLSPDLVVERVGSWCLMEQMLNTELKAWPRQILPDDPLSLWQQGAQFWIGRMDGHAATIAVSRSSEHVQQFFFPLRPRQSLISHCGTFPSLRGQGLYPAMLQKIVRRLATEGTTCVLIHCADWNTPSRRGIERAGFQPIGTGFIRRNGRLLWSPLPSSQQKPDEVMPPGPPPA